jgi:hypothetical protein
MIISFSVIAYSVVVAASHYQKIIPILLQVNPLLAFLSERIFGGWWKSCSLEAAMGYRE